VSVLTERVMICRCSLCQNVNEWIRIDDGMDVFKLHGIGGIVGSFLTGIFTQSWVSALDGSSAYTGGLDGNGAQVGRQFAEIASIGAYSFVVSCALLLALKYVPGLHLRVSEEKEMLGLDLDQFFDEQIGDWGVFEQNELRATQGVDVRGGEDTRLSSGQQSVRVTEETPKSG